MVVRWQELGEDCFGLPGDEAIRRGLSWQGLYTVRLAGTAWPFCSLEDVGPLLLPDPVPAEWPNTRGRRIPLSFKEVPTWRVAVRCHTLVGPPRQLATTPGWSLGMRRLQPRGCPLAARLCG